MVEVGAAGAAGGAVRPFFGTTAGAPPQAKVSKGSKVALHQHLLVSEQWVRICRRIRRYGCGVAVELTGFIPDPVACTALTSEVCADSKRLRTLDTG